jgi:aminoglycoside phosphotransferase (APT) family kinase protein
VDGDPGPLLGRGRHADVFEMGPTRVLRRYRTGQQAEPEASVMAHVRAHGFPAPEVFDVDGGDMVLERVDGPSLLHVMTHEPHRIRRHADLLAQLHHRLHRIAAPPALPTPFGRGDRVLHLDLQPANVILTGRGPVVLDWGWAAAGPAEADPAHTWLQIETSEVPGSAFTRLAGAIGRRLLVRRFLSDLDLEEMTALMPEVAAYRLALRELTPTERTRIHRFLQKLGGEDSNPQ